MLQAMMNDTRAWLPWSGTLVALWWQKLGPFVYTVLGRFQGLGRGWLKCGRGLPAGAGLSWSGTVSHVYVGCQKFRNEAVFLVANCENE